MKFDSDGFVELQIGDGPPVKLDPLDCNDAIATLQAAHPERQGDGASAYQLALADLIASWGVAKPAKLLALRIAANIIDAVSTELGKGGAGPAS